MPGNRFAYSPIFASPDRMIIWYSWSPVWEQGRIFDMSDKQLAIVGGKDFAAIDPDLNSWLVQDTEWATKGEGNSLHIVPSSKNPRTRRGFTSPEDSPRRRL